MGLLREQSASRPGRYYVPVRILRTVAACRHKRGIDFVPQAMNFPLESMTSTTSPAAGSPSTLETAPPYTSGFPSLAYRCDGRKRATKGSGTCRYIYIPGIHVYQGGLCIYIYPTQGTRLPVLVNWYVHQCQLLTTQATGANSGDCGHSWILLYQVYTY